MKKIYSLVVLVAICVIVCSGCSATSQERNVQTDSWYENQESTVQKDESSGIGEGETAESEKADNGALETAEGGYEEGRYGVSDGKPISSDNNIRSRRFIPVDNTFIVMSVSTPYTVTVHQYRSDDFESFIVSESGLHGGVVNLDNETRYVHLSIKKENNAEITPDEGENIKMYFSGYEELIEIDDSGVAHQKAMLTIIDDDGDEDFYWDVYPMALEKEVLISAAVPANLADKEGYMTWDMIREIQDNGLEILCHTYSHLLSTKIDELTQEDFMLDYSMAQEEFALHGIDANLLVFSGSTGLYDKAQNPAQELFRGAFLAGDNQTNFIGGDPYKIKRYRIGSDYPFKVDDLKELIDNLNETGGWMVWMMHTSNKSTWNSDVPNIIGEVIDYTRELNIPIVTAEEGFNLYYSQN